jgi:thioredoxin 1
MKTPLKLVIVAALAAAVIAAVAFKHGKSPAEPKGSVSSVAAISTPAGTVNPSAVPPVAAAKLPRLIDLGADKCIPCKMMAPILEEMKGEYAGRLEVVFIDVWKSPEAGQAFGIDVIPTQIFFDAEGTERFRHIGFFSKEDILGKWKELGVDLGDKPKPEAAPVSAGADPSKGK